MAKYPKYATTVIGAHSVPDWYEALDRLVAVGQLSMASMADAQFRSRPDDILQLQTRNADGQMVPFGAIMRVSETTGPDSAMRYNGFRSADINGGPAPCSS